MKKRILSLLPTAHKDTEAAPMSNCRKKAKPALMRRVLSCILSAALIFTLMPVVDFGNDNKAYAAADWEDKVWIGDTPVNLKNLSGNGWDFINGGNGYYTLELKDGFTCNSANALPDSNDKAFIQIKSLQNVTIKLLGNATIGTAGSEKNAPDGGNTYGIYAPDTNLAIEGTGTLNVYSNSNAIWCKDLRVEGPTLNCSSYRTAIRVMDSSAYLDKTEEGNMLVKSGAKVTARTTQGSGCYPEFYNVNGPSSNFYRDNGGAAILVSGSLTVEKSTVNAENTCKKTPDVPDVFNKDTKDINYFYARSFCTGIFVGKDLTVSGINASVTGKLGNEASTFGDINEGMYFKLRGVAADYMYVKEGGTIEGFITTSNNAAVTQGIGSFSTFSGNFQLNNACVCLAGEGVIRTGIAKENVAIEDPSYDFNRIGYYDATENDSPTDQYASHREITISHSTTVYLRTINSKLWWSFNPSGKIRELYELDSATIDLRDFASSDFVAEGWNTEWGFPDICVENGDDWTIIPTTTDKVDYYIESGTLTIQLQDQREYAGGHAYIAENATLNIQGNGIGDNWDISPLNSTDTAGGTVRFISGTVKNAQADTKNKVYILGGNINFNLKDYSQVVRREDGLQLYKDIYVMSSCTDRLTSIHTGEEIIISEESYYYPIGDNLNLVVWTVNDLPIKYVTVTPEDGESYNLIPGGSIEGLGNEYHSLVTAERYRKFVPNPNYQFFRNPDESVTMNAAGSINTYENRLDSGLNGSYLIGSATDLDSSLRAEWSYQNENDEKVVVGGNSLTCTIDDLSDITNYRTYTCTVYEKAAGGSEKAIGTYNARVYVMRWEQSDRIKAVPGQEVTFTANPSEETKWTGFLRTLKWQVNKGTGWEDIPGSSSDSYTVTITEENAGYKYRRVISGDTIGNYNTGESGIHVEFASPALSVTAAPEITSQPQSIRIHVLDTAKHEITVSANNAISYRWQKKVDGTFADIEGATSSTLEVGVGDVGTYRCIVSNKYGETVSEEASVGKGLAPSCGTLSGVNVTLGAKAQFGVGINNAPGDCGISVKWQYSADDGATWVDVVSIDDSKNISMNVLEMVFKEFWSDGTVISRTEISSSSMTINKTTADMDGWKVRCVLSDAFGVYYSNTVELRIDMPEYIVSFDTGEHGTAPEAIRDVKHGSTISAPVPPKADGYIFGGWYTDQACSADCKYDFSTPITQDTTLYAKWTKYYPYVPPVQNPIVKNDDNATTSADLSDKTSTSGGTTTANIEKAIGDEIVDKAASNKSEEIVIDATAKNTTAADSTTTTQVGIPTDTLGAISEKTDADVTVKTDVAEIKLDNTAAGAIAGQAAGDTVQIIVEKVDEKKNKVEFQLKVVCSDGNVISDFKGGNVAVTVTVPKDMAEKKIVCVFIDDTGRMSKVKGQKNADGTYTFFIGHFSTYALMTEEEAEAAIAAQKEEILAALADQKLAARSKLVTMKNGKKAVRITWYNRNGEMMDFDGVQIFRSIKRNSGYGKKPIFVTKSGKSSYYNTAIKKGTKYYYRVRGFVVIDGQKHYTDYSLKTYLDKRGSNAVK